MSKTCLHLCGERTYQWSKGTIKKKSLVFYLASWWLLDCIFFRILNTFAFDCKIYYLTIEKGVEHWSYVARNDNPCSEHVCSTYHS